GREWRLFRAVLGRRACGARAQKVRSSGGSRARQRGFNRSKSGIFSEKNLADFCADKDSLSCVRFLGEQSPATPQCSLWQMGRFKWAASFITVSYELEIPHHPDR